MLLTASVANAQQVQTGAGIGTCGQFAQDYQQGGSQAEKIYFAWAQGYMTGYNQQWIISQILERPNGEPAYRDLDTLSQEKQLASIRTYCNAHPLDKYADAVGHLLISLPIRHLPIQK